MKRDRLESRQQHTKEGKNTDRQEDEVGVGDRDRISLFFLCSFLSFVRMFTTFIDIIQMLMSS